MVALLDLLAVSWLSKIAWVNLYPHEMRQKLLEYQYSGFHSNESIRILVLEAGEANDSLKVSLKPSTLTMLARTGHFLTSEDNLACLIHLTTGFQSPQTKENGTLRLLEAFSVR